MHLKIIIISLISFSSISFGAFTKSNLDDIDIPPFTGNFSYLESKIRIWDDELVRIKDCGETQEISGDLRTKGPWVTSVFYKRGSSYKFLVTGTLVSPTLVLSILGGPYGVLPRGVPGKYTLLRPENLYIGAALKSAKLSKEAVDEHSQFSEVNYILPFNRHHARNVHYHLFLIHLKKPFNISTNYVRPICVHLDPRSYISIVKAKPHLVSDLPRTFNWKGYTAGFLDNNEKTLAVADGKAGFRKVCDSAFKYYYKNITDTAHVYCTRYKSCWTYGSPMAVYVNVLKKWMVGGLTALIPAKRRGGQCDSSTLYFNANFVYGQETEWILENILCGPDKFACAISGKCIPLSSVCNGIPDCDEQRDDEESIFCDLSNHCKNHPKNLTHPCGFKGKCISPDSLCDNHIECPDGSDELISSCNSGESSSLEMVSDSSDPIYCPPIPISEGVKMTCTNSKDQQIDCNNKLLRPGVTIRLSCKRFYSSKLRYSSITMTCGGDGFWDRYRTFACEPDCGVINSKDYQTNLFGGNPIKSEVIFPWYASIYKVSSAKPNTFEFICGGSLVESNVVITAAHCLGENHKQTIPDDYRVVLAPISSDYGENLQSNESVISKVLKYWVPPTYTFASLQSDIAVLKLAISVKYDAYIRPVCYLRINYQRPPEANSVGKIAGFGIDVRSGAISTQLKYIDIPVVSSQDCSSSNPVMFCAGDLNYTTAVCKGDSGGGLVFPTRSPTSTRSKVYVLKGITSHSRNAGLNGSGLCNLNDYTVFTHVDSFANWMNVILEQNDVDDDNLIAESSNYF